MKIFSSLIISLLDRSKVLGAYEMTIEVQEIDDVADHCWGFCSLLNCSVDDEVSPESSWFFDIGKCGS